MSRKKKVEEPVVEVDNQDVPESEVPEEVIEEKVVEKVLTVKDIGVRIDKLESNMVTILTSFREDIESLKAKVEYLDRYNPARG